jgi:hypothetical protein
MGDRGRAVLSLAGWSSLLTLVAMPVYNLHPAGHPTWQAALHTLATNGSHFGSDAVFTYGPLGFLVSFPRSRGHGVVVASGVHDAIAAANSTGV